jgi:hypothetical protein
VATLLSSLVTQIRRHLNEDVASFWTDQELADHMNMAIKDLWRALNDNYQDFFLTNDATNVTQAASATTLSGVPADVATVRGIEPRDLQTYGGIKYESLNYMHPRFQAARSESAVDPLQGGKIFFWITGAGAPIAAPTIYVAPALSLALPLRLVYVPTLSAVGLNAPNPIPGESDQALIAWCVAHAMAKRKESQVPDGEWLTIYSTEKAHILTSCTPRQTQDEEVVEALFEAWWQ